MSAYPPDDYDAIVDAASAARPKPFRTKKGALKFQPESDWSISKLTDVEAKYKAQTGQALPVRVRGQGAIHNKWNYAHEDSADISLNPSSPQGLALIRQLQEDNVPFLAFDHAIPGVATGPHIHIGRPSKRRGQSRAAATSSNPYDEIVASAKNQPLANGDGEYDSIVDAATIAQPQEPTGPPLTKRQAVQAELRKSQPVLWDEAVAKAKDAQFQDEARQPQPGVVEAPVVPDDLSPQPRDSEFGGMTPEERTAYAGE